MGDENTVECMDCGDTVAATAISEISCMGTCGRTFSVCALCKDDPYICLDCDQEESDEQQEDAEEEAPETD